jgi:hypothetical protein
MSCERVGEVRKSVLGTMRLLPPPVAPVRPSDAFQRCSDSSSWGVSGAWERAAHLVEGSELGNGLGLADLALADCCAVPASRRVGRDVRHAL